MPNIISRYSHASFRRSLGRRRYSGRHGSSVPAMTGICNSDMFEFLPIPGKRACSVTLSAEHRGRDSSEVLRMLGRRTLRPLPLTKANCQVRSSPISAKGPGEPRGELRLLAFVGISLWGLENDVLIMVIQKSPARYRRGISIIDRQTLRVAPSLCPSGGMRRCRSTCYRRTVRASLDAQPA
jgi:hypothetical protein